jgi:hypothetical protein
VWQELGKNPLLCANQNAKNKYLQTKNQFEPQKQVLGSRKKI